MVLWKKISTITIHTRWSLHGSNYDYTDSEALILVINHIIEAERVQPAY